MATRTHCARIATLLRWQNISLCALLISRPSYISLNTFKITVNWIAPPSWEVDGLLIPGPFGGFNKVINYVPWFLHPAAPPFTAGVTSCYCSLSVLLKFCHQHPTVTRLIMFPTPSIATHQHIHSVETVCLFHGSGGLSKASHH